MDLNNFKIWLIDNTNYCDRTIRDPSSRFKRANAILKWYNDPVYMFHLEQEESFKLLSCTVRSQIKRSVKLYFDFQNSHSQQMKTISKNKMRILSLFSNIGVAEAYLKDIGFDVVIANELIERRAALYSKIYPETHMICGDITNDSIKKKIISESKKNKIDIIIATPPCQGMSTAGQQDDNDERNKLICPVLEIINSVKPKYVLIENVPQFYNTKIEINEKRILITDLISQKLDENYIINKYTINTSDYSVPQTRERAIILMTKRGRRKEWILPDKDKKTVTMMEAIGHLPQIDPYVTDISKSEFKKMFPLYEERKRAALNISMWNIPPHHIKRQVEAMQHTPTGCSAFDNKIYYPKKQNGEAVKGYRNTYKRQNWDTAAYTITMDNRKISSQNNVHPGRKQGKDANGDVIYSDARTLTLYELMIIMSLPNDWPIPPNTPEAFLRRIIGEGIPPLFVRKVFENLK